MNNIFSTRNKKILAIAGVLLFSVFVVLLITNQRTNVIDPSTNTLDENPVAGKEYALLYNQGALYVTIREDEDNLRLIQEDLAKFARNTLPELSDPNTLLGFTFNDGFEEAGNVYTFTGKFYSVEDTIQLVVTTLDQGAIKLSITNKDDGQNIDDFLNLNGAKNEFIETLPIESDYYSIRYLKSQDKIVAAFYKGYLDEDVDKVVEILKQAFGNEYNESTFIFNINGVGIFSLKEVREYVDNPDNKF
jgi:hypothetical protein